jgi:hypothetical protein
MAVIAKIFANGLRGASLLRGEFVGSEGCRASLGCSGKF